MSLVFPERFDLEKLHGPRAGQFANREDAFQQLVGDGLMTAVGHPATVAPTKGQDGRIDAFVGVDGTLSGPFKDLPVPLIAECKNHDDTLRGVDDNVLAGWTKLHGKLRKQAMKGWPKLFLPWKQARGYAYCVSAFLRNKDTRDRLQRRIEKFFAKLPAKERPPVTSAAMK